MSSIFDVRVSLYRDAWDRDGRYVDPISGTLLRTLSLGDFLFGGYWQTEVEAYRARLREMTAKLGDESKAKKDASVAELKKRLPAATLSGYFEHLRRTDQLTAHTGFLALDVDHQDNPNLDPETFILALKDRPETAAILRSCSGNGYFVMVRLAYPAQLKEQFYSLYNDMRYQGIVLDKACSDVTRLRFASWDDAPYINENAVPYTGLVQSNEREVLQRKHEQSAMRQNVNHTRNGTIALVDGLVKKIVAMQKDIVPNYATWLKCGFALSRLDEDLGRGWFDAISRVNSGKYDAHQCARQYNNCCKWSSGKVDINYFLKLCSDNGIRLYEDRSLNQ